MENGQTTGHFRRTGTEQDQRCRCAHRAGRARERRGGHRRRHCDPPPSRSRLRVRAEGVGEGQSFGSMDAMDRAPYESRSGSHPLPSSEEGPETRQSIQKDKGLRRKKARATRPGRELGGVEKRESDEYAPQRLRRCAATTIPAHTGQPGGAQAAQAARRQGSRPGTVTERVGDSRDGSAG